MNAPLAANTVFHALNGLDLRPRAAVAVRSSVKRGARFLLKQRWRFERILPLAVLGWPVSEQIAEVDRRLRMAVALGRSGHWAANYARVDPMALKEARLALRFIRRFESAPARWPTCG